MNEKQFAAEVKEQLAEYTPVEVARKYVRAAEVLCKLFAILDEDFIGSDALKGFYDRVSAELIDYDIN